MVGKNETLRRLADLMGSGQVGGFSNSAWSNGLASEVRKEGGGESRQPSAAVARKGITSHSVNRSLTDAARCCDRTNLLIALAGAAVGMMTAGFVLRRRPGRQ